MVALIANYSLGDENRILLRLVDWVTQVKTLASEWTIEHFQKLPVGAIYSNQNLILYLLRKDRLKNDTGIREILRVLLELTRSLKLEEFFSLTAMFRRFLFSLSIDNDGQLRKWILDDPDPFNRILLLKKVDFPSLTTSEIEKLSTDKSVFIRRQLFHTQLDSGIVPSEESLIALSLNRNQSLRKLGQFYLNKFYQEDAYTTYRSMPGEEFFYIADYMREEDSELFLEGIRNGSKLTQYNCLRALAYSSQNKIKELEICELITRNRKLRAVILPILPKLLSLEEIIALRPILEATSALGNISYLVLLEKKSYWSFIDEGLDILLTKPNDFSYQWIIQALQAKVNISRPLSAKHRESISHKISKLRNDHSFPHQHLLDQMEFVLRTSCPS